MNNDLAILTQAEHMLASVARADDAAKLADMAEAARVYARKAELGTAAVNHATAIKVRALKRMAELVDEGQARGEIASKGSAPGSGNQYSNGDVARPDITVPVTLPDLGITRQRLHEARKLEEVDDFALSELVAEANEEHREISVAEVARTKMAVHYSTGEPDWHTPPAVITAAREALGGIDLDPCSNTGTPNVHALRHLTIDDDGLAHEWHGRVYMNPPYGRPIVRWVEKLVCEHEMGRTTAAVALVPARTDTDWFRLFRDAAVCFIDGRLKFSDHANAAPFPSAAVYLGPDVPLFARAFAALGDTWVRLA